MKREIITPEMIIEATIKYGAEYGLENVTTKKIAVSMSISEGTIFNKFPTKSALLVECLYYIDAKLDAVIKTVPSHGLHITKTVHDIWIVYFNYLVSHRHYAKFYCQFRQSSYYTLEVIKGQNQSFSSFHKLIQRNIQYFGFNTDFYWTFIIETTLSFAIHVADGQLPGTPKDIERIYGLISYGFIGNLKIIKNGTPPTIN